MTNQDRPGVWDEPEAGMLEYHHAGSITTSEQRRATGASAATAVTEAGGGGRHVGVASAPNGADLPARRAMLSLAYGAGISRSSRFPSRACRTVSSGATSRAEFRIRSGWWNITRWGGVSGMLYHTPCAQRVLKGRYHAKQQRSSIRLTTVTVDDAHALEHETARFDPVAPGRSFHHAPPRKAW